MKFNSLLAAAATVAVAGLAIRAVHPPSPAGLAAPPAAFSAARALSTVAAIAAAPHPLGSAADAQVRTRLVQRMSALGLAPAVFTAMGYYHHADGDVSGLTNDIVARLAGSGSTGAVTLMAHYDSTPHGPGAGDDAAGVAAILETVRALQSTPLRNDLMVVLTDGEEAGLLGADAFARSHPWARDIGVLLNLDARGDRGPLLLFETSAHNRGVVQAAATLPQIFGTSLAAPLYRRLLPNDTDFSVFLPTGTPGLNFALVAGLDAYHTSLDTPARLDQRSLQQEGDTLLDLARRFGGIDLPSLRGGGSEVFFDLWGGRLVAYSQSWIWPGEGLLLLLLVLHWRRRPARAPEFATVALPLLLVPAAMAACGLLVAAIRGRHPAFDTPRHALLFAAAALLGAAFGLAWLRRRDSSPTAALTLLTALSLAGAAAVPEGSYLLFWPLLLALTGSLLAGPHTGAWAGTLAAALLFAPLTALVFLVLTLTPLAFAGAGVLIACLLLLGTPLWGDLAARTHERY